MPSWNFPSKSRPGHSHTVSQNPATGNLYCTCEAFIYSGMKSECKHTKSVLGELAAGVPAEATPKVSNAGKNVDPDFPISPMLAMKPKGKYDFSDFSPDLWTMEEKFDGHRLILSTRVGQEPKAWSRLGNVVTLSERVAAELKRMMPSGMFDCERYLPGGRHSDVKALENSDKLHIAVFDVLKIERADAMSLPLTERRSLLDKIAPHFSSHPFIHIAEQYVPTESKLLELWDRGGEGGILKKKTAPYQQGKRSKDWIKLKKLGQEVVLITGFEAGESGPHSKILCTADDGTKTSVKTLNHNWLKDFEKNSEKYIGTHLLIAFQDRNPDGNFQHPMAKALLP